MLSIHKLHAYYDKSHVLNGVSLQVGQGEIVALLGRNGSGRSTLARAIMGMVQARGSIQYMGREIVGLRPFEIARQGVGYVPESRDVFPQLTVHQNLLLGRKPGQKNTHWSPEDAYRMFPPLRARQHAPAGVLSGGEQQMLTLSRTLMGDPSLMVIDEPTEGLAPMYVQLVGQYLEQLKARGISVLLIEQKLTIAMAVSDRVLVMGHGAMVFEGTPQALAADASVRREWLEV